MKINIMKQFKSLKISHISVLLIFAFIVFITFWYLCGNVFVSIDNIQSMALQIPELGILSLGMMVVLLTSGINLSLIATASLSGIISAFLLTRIISPGNTGVEILLLIFLIAVIGLIVSIIIGGINGILIAILDIPPILATLGTMMIATGVSLVLTGGDVIVGFPTEMQIFGTSNIFGIPTPFVIFITCAVIMAIFLNKTTIGLKTYLIGTNPLACLFSGINNKSVLIRTYMISGLCSGIAGLIMISRFNSARANYGESYLLLTILASVMGGVSSSGGFGKVSGVVLSLIILQMISSGFNLLGISNYLSLFFSGAILIVIMIIRYAIERQR